MKHIFVETEENRKKYIKQENKLIGIAIATIYGIGVLSSNLGYILRKFDHRDSIDDMRTSISDNSNINEDERSYFYRINPFLRDYEKYIDIPLACERLESFDILYKNAERKGQIITKGTYNYYDNNILYYIFDNDEEEYKSTINHELLHLISSQNINYPAILTEGVTSTICYEYNLSKDGYLRYRLFTLMLCEIVSSDTVVESYLKGDYSIIEKKLYEIIPDNKKIEKLTGNLNDYFDYYDHLSSNYLGVSLTEKDDKLYHEFMTLLEDCRNEISSTLSDYYTAKTGKLVGDSNVVESIYKLEGNYNEYDLKMSIYNAEFLRKEFEDVSTYDEKTGQKIIMYKYCDDFQAITDGINKHNEKMVSYNEHGEWSFVFDLKDDTIKSSKEIMREYIIKKKNEDTTSKQEKILKKNK